jgi:FAD/FMN-containing dehydrogenase
MSQHTQDAAQHDPHGRSSMDITEALEGQHASEQATRALALRLRGELLLPENPNYEIARGVWNGSVDRRPALLVRCTNAEEVIAAVTVAREQALALSVRSGGHSIAGYGTNEGGMVIDLSRMKAIHIDPERRTARIEPGLTWGEVSNTLQPSGLTLTAGDTATVGVGVGCCWVGA